MNDYPDFTYGPLRYHSHSHSKGHHVMACSIPCKEGRLPHPHRAGIDDTGMGPSLSANPIGDILKQPYAVVSAMRKEKTDAENADNMGLLNETLIESGFNPIEVEGVYKGGKEKAFLVPGLPEEVAVDMGRMFNQESVLANKKLMYTTEAPPVRFSRTVYGPEAEAQENHTVVSLNGRRQAFALLP